MTPAEREAALAELSAAFGISADQALILEMFFLCEYDEALAEAAAEHDEHLHTGDYHVTPN
jgi:hypothetical protein